MGDKFYGVVVVRLVDRAMLCKAPGVPTDGFTIPGTAWAELVSKCAAPHFRTSAFLSVTTDDDPTKETQLSYHVWTDAELGYAVIAGKGVSRRQGHATLDAIGELFRKMFVESPSQLTPKTVDAFVKPARDLLVKVSSTGSSGGSEEDKVQKVKEAVDEVKNMALDNVERAINRGQRIDDIVQVTDDLQFQAQGFQRSSRDLHSQLWWNSMRAKMIFGGVAAAFILLVLFTFFGGSPEPTKPPAL